MLAICISALTEMQNSQINQVHARHVSIMHQLMHECLWDQCLCDSCNMGGSSAIASDTLIFIYICTYFLCKTCMHTLDIYNIQANIGHHIENPCMFNKNFTVLYLMAVRLVTHYPSQPTLYSRCISYTHFLLLGGAPGCCRVSHIY